MAPHEALPPDPGELPTLEVPGRERLGSGDGHPVPPGEILGHYRLMDPVGSGGFGTVWRAQDLRLMREVALKILPADVGSSPEAQRLLEAEARTVAGLDHPGIVTLHALEEAEGCRFLVMELIRGRTLAELLPPKGFPLEWVLEVAVQLAEAVAAFHQAGVVHRDLNPRNLMVTSEGRLKVLDFGLALKGVVGRVGDAGGGWSGTLPYMSPEQIRGEALDARTDLYSVGVVLYQLLTGRQPFRGVSVRELAKAILEDEPDIPTTLPASVTALLRRCLAKERANRIQTAQALRMNLEGLRVPAHTRAEEGPSVAVLPFEDLSRHKTEGHFCEGMAEEILDALHRMPGLHVASRASAFFYGRSRLGAQEIARRLGVAALVFGRVRKEGEDLEVQVELVEAATGFRIWSAHWERDSKDLFPLLQDLSAAIASALDPALVPGSRALAPPNLEAYEDYLRGRQYYFRYNRQGIRFAMQMFQEALDRDPAYAAAWAGLADCAAFLYIYTDRTEEHRELAERASRRALELDAGLAEAWASKGVADSSAGRTAEADLAFERALALDPGLYEANYFYARHCFALGRLEQARAHFEAASDLHPEDCQAPLLVAQVYASLGSQEEASASRLKGLSRAEARLRRVPEDVRARYLGANALVALGEREKGLAWARMARALDPEDPMLLYNLGCIHALAGDLGAAIDCLEQAVKSGLTQKGWFLHDGDLEALRTQPRFQALVDALT